MSIDALIYLFFAVLLVGTVVIYLKIQAGKSKTTVAKVERAKEFGFWEPVSLHPVVNPDICIGSGACIEACPEKDILGLRNGRAVTINASQCVGHGACFHACPVKAISLHMGTEKRGVDLPEISPEFETNVPGLYIAGELGGMGLIKNAIEQGKQAAGYAMKKLNNLPQAQFDFFIVGAGPAGIAASLKAKESGHSFYLAEQDTLGGTVFSFPRAKMVLTKPFELPLHGKVKLHQTTKAQLIELWTEVLRNSDITVHENEKVESIKKQGNIFNVTTVKGNYTARVVILAIGRRGIPRKLGVPGEKLPKVFYRLLEPEHIKDQKVLVVGGGDSAIESALLLADEGNTVHLSYRSGSFSRLKPLNLEKINRYSSEGKIVTELNTTVKEIRENEVVLNDTAAGKEKLLANDLVYVFAGGELPNEFLKSCGIEITTLFGQAILKH